MIADFIVSWLDRLEGRRPYMAPYLDAVARRNSYFRRAADYWAADPAEYQRRYLAGLAVQRRARLGAQKNNVRMLRGRIYARPA
jgi:hypothetical protein